MIFAHKKIYVNICYYCWLTAHLPLKWMKFNFHFGVERLVVYSSNNSVSNPCPSFVDNTLFYTDENALLNKNMKRRLKKR